MTERTTSLAVPRRSGGLADTLLRETIDGDGPASSRVEDVDALPRGSMVGRYVVLSHVGAGGMGVVYAAYDPDLDRRVALKVLRDAVDGSRKGQQARARLLREGQAMAKVRHPNVIAVHDVGTDAQRVFIAMEFIDGCTLTDWLVRRRRSREEILAVFRAAGEGLAAAHRQGLIHRDFKPDNVLIGRDGRVCVVDFGLARRELQAPSTSDEPPSEERGPGTASQRMTRGAIRGVLQELVSDDDDSVPSDAMPSEAARDPHDAGSDVTRRVDGLSLAITRTGMLLGTPAYMAPEQHLGLVPGPASDQFSFCVALYEALYGERPFSGGSAAELMLSVTEAEVRPAPPNRRVPSWIRRVLLRGLRRRPRERWPDMERLLAALAEAPARRRRRRRGLVAAALALVGVGVGAGAWWGLGAARAPCDPPGWEGTWDATTKRSVATAFRATGKPFADSTWDAVAQEGDRFTDAWDQASAESCAATHDADPQPPEVWALRHACLEGARDRFASLVALWADADDEVVISAVDAVRALPDPARCDATTVLREQARDPLDHAARMEAQAQRRILDRARTLGRAHRIEPARRLVDAVLQRAHALHAESLRAEALLVRADLQEARGELLVARQTVHEALLAAEAIDDDRLAAAAWIDLLWLDGYRGAQPAAGHAAAEHARALLLRWPQERTLARTLELRHGDLLYAEGRYAQALARYQAVLAQSPPGPSPDPSRGDALTGVGLCEQELGRLDAALEHLQEAASIVREAYGAGHPYTASTSTNLGTIHELRGERDESLHHHERALEVAEASHGPEHPTVAEILNNLGGVLVSLDRLDEAEAAYVRAREIWRTRYGGPHPDVAMIAYNLGLVAYLRGERGRSRELHAQALAMREQGLGPDHPDVADSLEALAELDVLDGETARARERLVRALSIHERRFGPDGDETERMRARLRALPEASAP